MTGKPEKFLSLSDFFLCSKRDQPPGFIYLLMLFPEDTIKTEGIKEVVNNSSKEVRFIRFEKAV